jgi:hypothetical protein
VCVCVWVCGWLIRLLIMSVAAKFVCGICIELVVIYERILGFLKMNEFFIVDFTINIK